jgi:hypothetical protein
MGVSFDSEKTVNRLAELAQVRLADLLRLNSARHVYDPMPGLPGARFFAEEGEVVLNGTKRATQPYRNFSRFLTPEKTMPFLVEPGLVPLVKTMLFEARGRKVLVSRKPAPLESDRGAVGHVPGYGVRVLLEVDGEETILTWECLFGVL